MMKILITGKNSYIGGMFTEWMAQWPDKYSLDEVSVRGEEWKKIDFSSYDVVFHVAGIAHASSDSKLEEKYFKVNRDLTIEVAQKAKAEGVAQFVFMSSAIVFGTENKMIDEYTKPNPDNFYGDSKLQAEQGILPLQDENFIVAIIRPPMIYGKDSKGNYPLLSKLARITPFFPNYPNKRSMLYVENLCEFIRLIMSNEESGIYHPQNRDLVKTSDMVRQIAEHYNNNIMFTKIANPLIKIFLKVKLIQKVFGDLYYEESLSFYDKGNYQLIDFQDSIERTEKSDK